MPVIPVVQVGNSHRLRIPKKLWDAIGAPTQVQLDVQDGFLIIRPLSTPRLGWDNPSKWPGTALLDEDQEWLNAPLNNVAEAEAEPHDGQNRFNVSPSIRSQ